LPHGWLQIEGIRKPTPGGCLAQASEVNGIPEGRPEGASSKTLTQSQQKFDLETSLNYCKNVLGLGMKD